VLDNVKHTIKHTAIYSLGNIATKCIGIILLPLYIPRITVSEYGILGILEITILILSQFLTLGQPQAYLRFHDSDDYAEKRKSTFFTIFVSLLVTVALFNIIGQRLVSPIASHFSQPSQFSVYFRLCFYIIALRVLNTLFLSVLRAQERSILYIVTNLIKFGVILGANIYFVVLMKLGVQGILYAYLIGDGLLILMLIPAMIPVISLRFDRRMLIAALAFGVPLIFGGLAHMLLDMGGRYILKLLVNYREAGLYHLGYKIAGVLNMFFIVPFQLGWLPISFKMFGQDKDKRYYSKMLTYFMFVLIWAGLGLAFFYKEAIGLFAKDTDYWNATVIVPYIILGYIFSGGKTVVNLSLYLTKKTNYIAYITFAAVVVNIGLNFLLIPVYRMTGAAIATVASFMFLYFVTYFIAKRTYPIPYEKKKLVTMLAVSLGLFILGTTMGNTPLWPRIALKTGLLLSFPLILYPLKFYEKIEIERIVQFFRREKTWQNDRRKS